MKKSLLVVLLLVITSRFAEAQKDYVAPVFSYGFVIEKSDIYLIDEKYAWSGDTVIYSYNKSDQGFSMGGGLKTGLIYGHHFNKYIGMEISALYARPGKRSTKNKYYEEFIPLPTYNYTEEYVHTYSLHALNLAPSLTLSAGKSYWNPYVKCGALFVVQFMTEEYEKKVVNRYPGYEPYSDYSYKYRYQPVCSYGATGAIGLEWMNDRKLNIFTEVQFQCLSYTPVKATMKAASKDGTSILLTIPETSRELTFSESVNELSERLEYPTQRIRYTVPMNSVNIMAGVRINLSGN